MLIKLGIYKKRKYSNLNFYSRLKKVTSFFPIMLNFLRKHIGYNSFIRRGWHFLRGFFAAVKYGFPGRKLQIIGVTGTNGKTTTTHMVEHILRHAGRKVGMVSTARLMKEGKIIPNKSKKTTLSPFKTQKFLNQCVKEGIEYVVLEASSHALHQFRLWSIPFKVAVLTNITHEHLDYHGSLAEYAKAKRLLFEQVVKTQQKQWGARLKTPCEPTLVINTQTRFFKKFTSLKGPRKIVYGLDQGDLQAKNVEKKGAGTTFCMRYKRKQVSVELPLLGEFNVENALAAAGAGVACGLSFDEIRNALNSFEGVPGRMECIKSKKGFDVLVDFALTPDALDRLYQAIRKQYDHRVIGIIGSCGDRDKKKRPDMGRVVAEHTDITIVTDEEPYSEDPMKIMKAVLKGAEKVKVLDEDLFLIEDRYKAIEFACEQAKKGDVVVVTGMGSFDTRTMNDGPMPWDERKVVMEILEKLESK